MTNYKLLAIDLDDTLLTRKKTITDESKKWIKKASVHGVTVIISTGRGCHNMKQYREELGLKTPMVLVNGAESWDESVQIIKRDYIESADIQNLYHLTEDYNVDFWAYGNETFVKKQEWTPEMLNERWTQFVIRHDDPIILAQIRNKIMHTAHHLEITSSSKINVEFTYKGVSKAAGVKSVCDYLGITMKEVMAIGDNHNDLQLIKSAGLGIAMGNAVPKLKEIADDITDTNEADGVAKAIQKHIFGLM